MSLILQIIFISGLIDLGGKKYLKITVPFRATSTFSFSTELLNAIKLYPNHRRNCKLMSLSVVWSRWSLKLLFDRRWTFFVLIFQTNKNFEFGKRKWNRNFPVVSPKRTSKRDETETDRNKTTVTDYTSIVMSVNDFCPWQTEHYEIIVVKIVRISIIILGKKVLVLKQTNLNFSTKSQKFDATCH